MTSQALQLKQWFTNHKSIIEKEYQKQLDTIPMVDEIPKEIREEDPDSYQDNLEDR